MKASGRKKNPMLNVFWLGAGKPNQGQSTNPLKNLGVKEPTLIWQFETFKSLKFDVHSHFLGGYQAEKILKRYPKLNFTFVPDWQKGSPLKTLEHAPFNNSPAFITYADTIFHSQQLKTMAKTKKDFAFAIDSRWHDRFAERSKIDQTRPELYCHDHALHEFCGLIFLRENVSQFLQEHSECFSGNSLLDFIYNLQQNNFSHEIFDVKGEWAEFNQPQDIAQFILGTKAQTLKRLEPMVKKSFIKKQICVVKNEWDQNPSACLNKIQNKFSNQSLIIRSSSQLEDAFDSSNAGAFLSVKNIFANDKFALTSAINKTFESYGPSLSPSDEVLVQPFIHDAKISGVAFTCVLESGAPYYKINFNENSNATDAVTKGSTNELSCIFVYRDCPEKIQQFDKKIYELILALKEIEDLLNFTKLDIEFAIDSQGKICILQVRPITLDHSNFEYEAEQFKEYLQDAHETFALQQAKCPRVFGETTIFGSMPDWNPAEIIGARPRPLAASLYRFLITNDIWAEQRSEFGYKNVFPKPLLLHLAGQPFVDVRASFSSFIPAHIDNKLAKKLVDFYIFDLKNNPRLHDKIEFAVALTCWTPDFSQNASKRLSQFGFTISEIKKLEEELKKISLQSVLRWQHKEDSFDHLAARRNEILKSDCAPLDKAYALLKDCLEQGTKTFAHAARNGFVANQFLNGLVSQKILSAKRAEEFLKSVSTVAKLFDRDLKKFGQKIISLDYLIETYGHLRPGTYDITSLAYHEDPNRFFSPSNKEIIFHSFELQEKESIALEPVLREIACHYTAQEFFEYMRYAIEFRELSKFLFTKNLSAALDQLILFGEKENISRDDLSYLTWSDFEQKKLNCLRTSDLYQRIEVEKQKFILTKMVELPALVCHEDEIFAFKVANSEPNFITHEKTQAEIFEIDSNKRAQDLCGKVVLITHADPGFDWLFSQQIAGLITQFGGANSHMAIRAAELGLPAAIGVGPQKYSALKKMRQIEIDCAGKTIRELS